MGGAKLARVCATDNGEDTGDDYCTFLDNDFNFFQAHLEFLIRVLENCKFYYNFIGVNSAQVPLPQLTGIHHTTLRP